MTLARPVVVAVVALTFVGLAAAAHPGAQEPEAVEAELALDRPTRRLIQQGLAAEGFDPGAPDGLFGPRTRAAIRAWQAAREHAGTGYLDAAQAGALRTAAAPPPVAAADTSDPPAAVVAAAAATDAGTVRAASQPPGPTAPSPPPLSAPAVPEADPAATPAAGACDNWNTEEFFETATVEEVTACLAAGADTAAQDRYGRTPLHQAARYNESPAVVDALLAAGADIKAQNGFGDTPLHRGGPATTRIRRWSTRCWRQLAPSAARSGTREVFSKRRRWQM